MGKESLSSWRSSTVSAENGAPSRCEVLHVVWGGLRGGAQTQLATLVRAMNARPGAIHRVCFLEGRGPVADRLVAEGLAFRLGFRRGWDPRDLWRFARILRQVAPSVVHFHSSVLGPALVATAVAPGRCVFSQHGLRTETRNRIFYGALRRRFTRFVVAAPALHTVLRRYGVEAGRIVHLPYPLTVPARSVSEPKRISGASVVGIAARLEREKRVDVFIDVIAELRRRGVDCVGVIVGEGSLRADLEEQAQSCRVDAEVRFEGGHDDVLPWLDGFDVCLMTSDQDVYPLLAIEAMARGVPLVAMPCAGGLPELAAGGGLLLADREPATAATTLLDLFESPERRAEIRARGAAVAARHALDTVIPVYEEFYDTFRREHPATVTSGAHAASQSRS